jgi:hypothetical protein
MADRIRRVLADPQKKADYIDSLRRRLQAASQHLAKVQGNTSLYGETARTQAEVRISQLEAELLAIEDVEWTKELTAERRAAWNQAVRNPKYRAGGVVFSSAIERDLGFSLESLRRQIERWGSGLDS